MDIRQFIHTKALDLGFDTVGITSAEELPLPMQEAFSRWLEAGHAGPMGYLHRNQDKRFAPRKLLSQARSIIVVGLNYNPGPASESLVTGRIARYAYFEDYHGFIKERLFTLAEAIHEQVGHSIKIKACVDSVPLAERALAQRAGLGFIGKNHMLIHPQLGPEVFLGELITSLDLPTDEPSTGDCGSCRRCLEACPTGALRPDGGFDASRCLNTLTIEQRDDLSPDLAALLDGRLYGCDECVLCCPFTHKAPVRANRELRELFTSLDPHEVLTWSQDDFDRHLQDSPIHRIGLAQLQRNARLCLDP